jgi:hippurate hydrolase
MFAIAAASLCRPAQADDPGTWIKSNLDPLMKLYLDLHRNPELSFQEVETSEKIARELEAVGATVTRNIGGYGVVGIIENGEGSTVMVRTDLDGLPVTEQTNQPYASTKKITDADGKQIGVMHACGHDIHMSTLIGVARYLAANKDRWSGRLMLIGQPAEERGSGARAMLDAGLFTRFEKPDYALALHCNSTLPTGTVSLRSGYAMANVDSVDIEVYGRGGHGAYPHATIDPIVEAAKLILDLQTIVSREIKPIEPAVITVGSIHAGTKHNITPDSCHLQLTVRSYSDEVRKHLLEAIRRKAQAAAMSVGAKEPEITVSEGTPSLSNNDELAVRMRKVFQNQLGDNNVIEAEPVMGGEDFSEFGRDGVPSLMYFLGVVDAKRLDRFQEMGITPPSLHSAEFCPDFEKSLETGVVSMSSAVLELMGNKQ